MADERTPSREEIRSSGSPMLSDASSFDVVTAQGIHKAMATTQQAVTNSSAGITMAIGSVQTVLTENQRTLQQLQVEAQQSGAIINNLGNDAQAVQEIRELARNTTIAIGDQRVISQEQNQKIDELLTTLNPPDGNVTRRMVALQESIRRYYERMQEIEEQQQTRHRELQEENRQAQRYWP